MNLERKLVKIHRRILRNAPPWRAFRTSCSILRGLPHPGQGCYEAIHSYLNLRITSLCRLNCSRNIGRKTQMSSEAVKRSRKRPQLRHVFAFEPTSGVLTLQHRVGKQIVLFESEYDLERTAAFLYYRHRAHNDGHSTATTG